MPLVSVIIPNYNHAPYLKQRIDSVLSQTFHDLEIVLLDDCSSDRSGEIIENYRNDARVRIVLNRTNSGGVFKQWNRGLGMASGKYVWIAESDDYAAPTLLETLVARLESDPDVGVAFCDSFRVCEDQVSPGAGLWFGEFTPAYREDFTATGREIVARQFLFRCMIANASSAVFRRSVAESIGGADESFRLSGDWLFWIRMLERSNLAYVAEPLNYFRQHPQSVRAATIRNGVALTEAHRIALHVLSHYTVAPADAKKVRTRLTDQFVEAMLDRESSMTPAQRERIGVLARQLNPYAGWQVWAERTGLRWLWFGLRRRARDVVQGFESGKRRNRIGDGKA
jgi:hypothetical protein